ncbi:MAG: lytic murein transglycosylase, partial [Hyphomicrobiaceae bacterium]|nr:lytic murein transglycosylase [Hyphomicrobiaceae bacterium]
MRTAPRVLSYLLTLTLTGVALQGPSGALPAAAASAAFERWVGGLWSQATKKGVSKKMFRRAFKGVSPDPEVLKRAEHQPEFV